MARPVDPRWACFRKKAYPTEEIAEEVKRKVIRHNPGLDLNTYPCTNCGQYHIGHRSRKNKEQSAHGT